MSTIDEILESISETDVAATIDEVLVIDPNTRQINLPSAELTFGVESDTHSERKYFLCPRVVGDNLDLTSCFIRVNYRNANGDIDAYLVDDVTVVDDNILFSWLLSRKVTQFAGQVRFVVCASRPGRTGADVVEWHTTQTNGISLAGLEPDASRVEAESADVLAQLLALVETQTEAVTKVGAEQVAAVQSTGETVSEAVVATAEAEKTAVLDEIEAKGTNTLASIPDDYTALGEAVDSLTRNTAGAIVCEVEGTSAYVSDASDNYVQSLRVFGRSTQDGVPSPDAPVEIESVENPTVTVCGKNLLNVSLASGTHSGLDVTVYDDGKITAKGTATGGGIYLQKNLTLCPGTYTFSVGTVLETESGSGIWVYGGDVRAFLRNNSDITFTVEQKTAVDVYLFPTKGAIWDVTIYPQLESGDTATTFELGKETQTLPIAHTLNGIPVSSGGNYTDSNGQQWICDEVDLERGVYVQRVKETIITRTPYFAETADLPGRFNWYCLSGEYKNGRANAILNFAQWSAWGGAIAGHDSGGVSINQIYYTPANTMTVDEVNDKFAKMISDGTPPVIVGQLETPIETPLSETEIAAYRALHTNKPNTTVLNDAGAWMNVEYVADTKLYIDNKIAAIVSGT